MSWRIGDLQQLYLKEVNEFLTNEEKFNHFKRPSHFMGITGSPSYSQAQDFFARLPKEVLDKLPEFMEADKVGYPNVFHFGEHLLSFNLLRQLDSIRILKEKFGSLDGLTVAEFGAGWGGTAFCIQKVWKPASYHIHDLEPVMDLAVRHSEKLGVKVEKGFPSNPDLVISEYAITEHKDDTLYPLTDEFLMKADKLFIRSNIREESRRTKWVNYLRQKFDLVAFPEVGNRMSFDYIIVGSTPAP